MISHNVDHNMHLFVANSYTKLQSTLILVKYYLKVTALL